MWVNINGNKDFNMPHVHLNSHFSGVFYSKLPKNSGKLVFQNPYEGIYYLWDNLEKEDECFIYGKDNFGVKNIKTSTNYYYVKSDYNEVVKDFENDIGLTSNFKVDYYKDKDLFNFVKEGKDAESVR